MKNAIILHGMPSKEEYFNGEYPSESNKHWLPWVQKQLILNGILTQTIELPEPYEPVYEKWLSIFEQFKIDENTTLIGHSCGAGFLIRWLSENKKKVGKVALIAPFLDPDHKVKSDFFSFEIDKSFVDRTNGLAVYYSIDDDNEILTSVHQIIHLIPESQKKEFNNYGHFTLEDMRTEKFPELVEWLV